MSWRKLYRRPSVLEEEEVGRQEWEGQDGCSRGTPLSSRLLRRLHRRRDHVTMAGVVPVRPSGRALAMAGIVTQEAPTRPAVAGAPAAAAVAAVVAVAVVVEEAPAAGEEAPAAGEGEGEVVVVMVPHAIPADNHCPDRPGAFQHASVLHQISARYTGSGFTGWVW
jgi:hypothetical protein